MNIDVMIKEYENLKFKTSTEGSGRKIKKIFPHIMSKGSFENMVENAEKISAQPDHTKVSPPQSISHHLDDNMAKSASPKNTPPRSSSPSHSDPNSDPTNASYFQQTSVITSNDAFRKKSEFQRRSIRRQGHFDESSDNMSDVTQNTPDDVPRSPFGIAPPATFDNGTFQKYKSRSMDAYTEPHKSKSLEIPRDPAYPSYPGNYPKMFAKHDSFSRDEESARRNINALHISSPYPHLSNSMRSYSGESSLSREASLSRESSLSHEASSSDSANSPKGSLKSSPLRNLQEIPDHIPARTYSNPLSQLHMSRSYERQVAVHHKYSQRKAYSLNTAPYDLIHREKGLRRILSEEIVPEYPFSETRTATQQHMRRAASYDLAAYVKHGKMHINEKLSGSVGNFYPQPSSKAATKIIFPEHDNVKDYKDIFVKSFDEEAIRKMEAMEKSNLFANPHFDFANCFSSPFREEEDNKNKNEQMKNKTKPQQQNSQDNLVIGPYKYDPESDDKVAVCVSGLLTLPGSNEKRYQITVGELRRRIAPPEYLNKVDMISYVRLAKQSARELLEKHAIRPKHHSRKSRHSVISKMCEAECTELSNGIQTLSEAYFPKEWLAKQAIAKMQDGESNEEEKKRKLLEQKKKVDIARSVLQNLSTILDENKSDDNMQTYNQATHNYGHQNLSHNIELINSLLQMQSNEINQSLNASDAPSNQRQVNNNIEPMETDMRQRNENNSMETHMK